MIDVEEPGDDPLARELAKLLEDDSLFARQIVQCREVQRELEDELPFTDAARSERFGDYRLLRLIGEGGMGKVYEAWQESLGRRVALKILTASLFPNSDALKRIRTEARVNANVEHAGVCAVYDAGEYGGVAYIAMRYVEGETLYQKLHPDEIQPAPTSELDLPTAPLSVTSSGDSHPPRSRTEIDQWVGLIEKVARVLHVTHESGFVHRDVKPANIMVQPSGEPVLLDFGLAREIEESSPGHTQTGDVLGTPVYMSPEQIRGVRGEIDRRTDVWSLGATLYECLTGKLPFDAATREALFHAILKEDPEDCRRLNRSISKDLKTVIDTALDKDPKRRYQTALDFAEDLRRVRVREPIRARPASLVLRGRRWAQRNPALVTPVLGVVLVLTASVGFLVLNWGPWNRAVLGPGMDRVLVGQVTTSPTTLSVKVDGCFTTGQLAVLRVSESELRLAGEVENGEIQSPWPDLKDLPEGTHVAEVVVLGPLGREIHAVPFQIEVDRTAPQLTSVTVNGELVSADDPSKPARVLCGTVPRVQIRADEDLDAPPELWTLAKDRRTLTRELVQPKEDLALTLKDRAGNPSTLGVFLEWVETPKLLRVEKQDGSPMGIEKGSEVRTNAPVLTLVFDVPGYVQVVLKSEDDDPRRQKLGDNAREESSHELWLPLDPDEKGEQDFSFIVRTWPDLDDPADPAEQPLRVLYLRRGLEVDPLWPKESLDPPSFEVRGETVPNSKWEWELDVQEAPKGASLTIDAQGRLRSEGSPDLPSGTYELSVRVEDAFGNEGEWTQVPRFKFGVPYPGIDVFQLKEGSQGTEGNPIHHHDCVCPKHDLEIVLNCRPEEGHDLSTTLWMGEPGVEGSRPLVDATVNDESILVPLDDVIHNLPEGSDRVQLYVLLQDTVDPRIQARKHLDLFYESEPLEFVFDPSSGGLLKSKGDYESPELKVTVTGPRVNRVTVHDPDDAWKRIGEDRPPYVFSGELGSHGYTKLTVTAELERGKPHETTVLYYGDPSQKREYQFEVPGIGELSLRFHRPRDGLGFWYLKTDEPVSLDEAEDTLRQLLEAIRGPWPDQGVRLPFLDEVESLYRAGRIKIPREATLREWLCDEEKKIADFGATVATLNADQDPGKEGADPGQRCGLRVILPYREIGDVLTTLDALDSQPIPKGQP